MHHKFFLTRNDRIFLFCELNKKRILKGTVIDFTVQEAIEILSANVVTGRLPKGNT